MKAMLVKSSFVAALTASILGVGIAQSSESPLAASDTPTGASPVPEAASFRPSVEERHAGQTWTAGLATNGPETCVELRSPSGQRSGSCYSASDLAVLGPIRAYSGGIGDVRFLYGTAAPTVKTLKLVRSDCSVQTLDVAPNGVFLNIDASSAASPYKVSALAPSGDLIASTVLRGRGVGSPPSGAC
jgi:hypothetical protein